MTAAFLRHILYGMSIRKVIGPKQPKRGAAIVRMIFEGSADLFEVEQATQMSPLELRSLTYKNGQFRGRPPTADQAVKLGKVYGVEPEAVLGISFNVFRERFDRRLAKIRANLANLKNQGPQVEEADHG